MAATVAKEMPSAAETANGCRHELTFWRQFAHRFRAACNGRCGCSGTFVAEPRPGRPHHRRPSAFISGKQDWGTYQRPGVYEAMQSKACTNMIGCHLVDGAGHWVQQEQPAEVSRLLLAFLRNAAKTA